jgi:signal recognition particle GTPase
MKSLFLIILLVLAGIAGYNFINKPAENVETVAVEENMAAVEETEAAADNEVVAKEVMTEASDSVSMITPADMSEEAQQEMYASMMEYNKCMMQDKPEYHLENVRAEDVAGATLEACEPHLDTLIEILTVNDVNMDLREGMIKTVRQRSTRKLMSAVMQSQAAQIMGNEAEVAIP